jgi:ubiquitin carboxyl-terminal hydrolase 8
MKEENEKNRQEKELIKLEYEKYKSENEIIKQENEKIKEEIRIIKKENEIIKQEIENNTKKNEIVKQENNELNKKSEDIEKEIRNEREEYNLVLDYINKIFENNEPLNLFSKPTLIGLKNIGTESYINPVLQCFSQTKFLTNYFLKKSIKDKKMNNNIEIKTNNSIKLYQLYIELIDNLWIKNGVKSFSPDNFKFNIERMNPIFRNNQNGSSKDFIIFLLTQLHKELAKPSLSNNNKSNLKVKQQQPLNQYNQNIVFENFINGFSQEVSIISDFFFGFTETTIECLNCKNNYNFQGLNSPLIYNYGIFNCIIFKLEEINERKKKNNSQNNNFIQNNHISIYDYFFFKKESSQNQNFCLNCNKFCESIFNSKIFLSPYIIIIILEREKYKKTSIKLDFTETIHITQFAFKNVSKFEYNLYAVITSINKGNYNSFVASIKSPIDNKWYRYDDEKVYPINNIETEVIEFGTPKILFYEKKGLTL